MPLREADSMRLDELIAPIGALATLTCATPSAAQTQVTQLAYDSRCVHPGTLFFCVSGFKRDGHDFAEQALADGAVALVLERRLNLGVPEILVASTRAAMAPIAARFYGDPSSQLAVIGITGTNGKTTTAFLVRALLQAQGTQCGLLGTVRSVIGGVEHAAVRTTPEAIDLHGTLRAMLDGGDRACAMEVSSHALALDRAAEVHFASAVFTNLTQDHLDFHSSMEDYFQTKRRLFIGPAAGHQSSGPSVINIDDPYGRRLADELQQTVTYAIDCEADYRARIVKMDRYGAQ
ncbi:MAG: Mur ligase family protein, partial [Solirubrobacteraceae bacterium]